MFMGKNINRNRDCFERALTCIYRTRNISVPVEQFNPVPLDGTPADKRNPSGISDTIAKDNFILRYRT